MSVSSEESGRADRPEVAEVLGKVASPPGKESTCDTFHFWVRRDAVVERTQIVRTTCRLGGRDVAFYALVDEVFRQGRPRSIPEASDGVDGDVEFEPPFEVPGVTYASATILRTDPPVLAPPLEGSDVVLGGEAEAAVAYESGEGTPLALGLIKNGGSRLAGRGCIDLDYLLGQNGGHLNVNGVAGRGTKSSFLLHLIYLLDREARRQAAERPSGIDRLKIVPIIFNVKNFDLFYIDRRSTKFDASRDLDGWTRLGIDAPAPFGDVELLAPQGRNSPNAVDTGREGVKPYSWSLADVIRDGLFAYLFAEDDIQDENFGGLALDLEEKLTQEDRQGGGRRSLADQGGDVRTFDDLIRWVEGAFATASFQKHAPGTKKKFERRLAKLVREGDGVLRRSDPSGNPPRFQSDETRGPRVIDISSLAGRPAMQRFVVAAILRQLVDERTGGRVIRGLRYLVMLDELNRFAPRGQKDPVTRLIETVAAEMRSQGIILLGAQQQASLVSTRVFENAGIKALGRSGSMEMGHNIWRLLGESARRKAASLDVDEKLLVQDSFREPMLVRIPRPPWALNFEESLRPEPAGGRRPDPFDE